MAVPVHVVREVLALRLVLALGGAGEEALDPGEVRDQVVFSPRAVVGAAAVGDLRGHAEPDAQSVEEDDGEKETHFVEVGWLVAEN